jgi:hypothetical protein
MASDVLRSAHTVATPLANEATSVLEFICCAEFWAIEIEASRINISHISNRA